MKNRLGLITILFPILFLTVIFSGSGFYPFSAEAAVRDVKIGILLPLGTPDGVMAKEGIQVAIDEWDSRAKGAGQEKEGLPSVEFIWEDDEGNPDAAARRMEKLVAIDKVAVVIGPLFSSTAMFAAPVANRNKVIMLSPLASTPELAKPNDYIFRTWPSDGAEAAFLARRLSKEGMMKMALLTLKKDYGVGLNRAFKKEFETLGGKIVSNVEYDATTANFKPLLSKIAASKPQGIYFVGFPPDMGMMLRQAREMRVSIPFYGASICEDPGLVQVAQTAADGIIYPFPSGFNVGIKNEAVSRFVEGFKKLYDRDPGFISAQAYDTIKLVLDLLPEAVKSGKGISEFLFNALPKTDIIGATGRIRFDRNGDIIRDYQLKTIKAGQYLAVDRVK